MVLITFLHLHQGIEKSRYRWVDAPMDVGETKMDAGLFFGATLSWYDVAVIIECKLQKEKSQSIARSQLKRAAELVFCNQFRLFVWGIFVFSHKDKDNQTKIGLPESGSEPVTKYKYKLHLYTRSGILYSKEHDLDTGTEHPWTLNI